MTLAIKLGILAKEVLPQYPALQQVPEHLNHWTDIHDFLMTRVASDVQGMAFALSAVILYRDRTKKTH